MAIGIVLLLITINIYLGQAVGCRGYFIFDPYINTEFSSSFDLKKAESIKSGMDSSEVERLLGQPLNKDFIYGPKWYYSDRNLRAGVYLYYDYFITYDTLGKVKSVTAHWTD